MSEQAEPITEVHVVWQVEYPDDSVLGVFTDPDEAKSFMESVRKNYEGGVFSQLFPIGMKGADMERRYLDD